MRFSEYLKEGIIIPDKIKINTLNVKKLNKQFKDTNITFYGPEDEEYQSNQHSDTPHAASYSGNKDYGLAEISVFVDSDANIKKLETDIEHEILHSKQHKKSTKSTMHPEMEDLMSKAIDHRIAGDDEKFKKTRDQVLKKMEQRGYGWDTYYEKMAYAFTMVKRNKNAKNVNVVIDQMKKWLPGFPIDNQFKKYVGMYWMVRKEL